MEVLLRRKDDHKEDKQKKDFKGKTDIEMENEKGKEDKDEVVADLRRYSMRDDPMNRISPSTSSTSRSKERYLWNWYGVPCYAILYYTTEYYTLYYTCYAMLYYTTVYYTLYYTLYYTCYTLLYCTLNYIILYYTILYCTI